MSLKNTLKFIENEYKRLLIDVAILKSVLYQVVTKENIKTIEEYLEIEVENEKNLNKDIDCSTNTEVFLRNLIKDKKN